MKIINATESAITPDKVGGQCLAISSVPMQTWGETYDLQKALQVGTIFPDLHKPFYLGGDEKC